MADTNRATDLAGMVEYTQTLDHAAATDLAAMIEYSVNTNTIADLTDIVVMIEYSAVLSPYVNQSSFVQII